MKQNLEKVKAYARDLRKEEPRSPETELGDFPFAARCVDKCRASLLGWQGEYTYGCPMDRRFLDEAGIDADELKAFVATGASDREVADWVREQALV